MKKKSQQTRYTKKACNEWPVSQIYSFCTSDIYVAIKERCEVWRCLLSNYKYRLRRHLQINFVHLNMMNIVQLLLFLLHHLIVSSSFRPVALFGRSSIFGLFCSASFAWPFELSLVLLGPNLRFILDTINFNKIILLY